ncbi:MAG: ABC transporter permease [Propionibacteriaceae bacterium]|jgi:D-methionine transport system permease protein|nr:ABC transporter permease [Propionibacteriaceae bacterium]
MFENWNVISAKLLPSVLETFEMVIFSSLFAILIGLPIGVFLVVSDKNGLNKMPVAHAIVAFIVNIGRSLPFIVLMVAISGFTKLVVGSRIGWEAATVPLAVGAMPFYARLAETAIREVERGKIESAQMMGASRWQIITGVLIPEAVPGLVSGATITVVTLVSYSAMAGFVGGGGLGALAQNYGWSRFMGDVMLVTVIAIIIVVQIFQLLGDACAKRMDHRR